MKRLILIISLLSIPAVSQAFMGSGGGNTIYLEETFFPKYVNKNDTTSITTAPGVANENGLGFDTRTTFGYMFFDQSFLLGFSYNYYSLSTKRANVQGGDPGLKQTTAETQFGPTIGWLSGGFRTLFTLFMAGEKEVKTINFDQTGNTANATITNKGVNGYQFTIGYTFPMWGMEIGPSLIYTSISYDKQKNTDKLTPGNSYSYVSLYSKTVDNNLSPMLSLIARF